MNIIKPKNYWRKLDDQAKIYSLSRNDYDTSVFRLSVILKDKINQKILEKAVIKTICGIAFPAKPKQELPATRKNPQPTNEASFRDRPAPWEQNRPACVRAAWLYF